MHRIHAARRGLRVLGAPLFCALVAMASALAGCEGEGIVSHGRTHRAPTPVKVAPFAGQATPDLVILVTGSTYGLMEICNCDGPMVGGLARRHGLALSYRHTFGNVLLLDSGDVFHVDPDDLRNEYILRGYAMVGYDAVVLGDNEWACGPGMLARRSRPVRNVVVSTSVRPAEAASEGAFADVVTRTFRGRTVSVVSYVGDDAMLFFPASRRGQIRRLGLDAVRARIASLKKAGHVVVAVAHGSGADADALARNTRADVVVRGNTARCDESLRYVNGTPIVRAGGHESVGALALIFAPDGRVAEAQWRVETVDERWPLDKRLIDLYQAYCHEAMRQALDADRKTDMAYVASRDCGRCHQPQYRWWQGTAHARAHATLRRIGREKDSNCLMCHTSGLGTKRGFRTLAATPEMANVNCQDCHRLTVPEHRESGYRAAGVSSEVCTSCHTPVTDPTFDLGRDRAKVRCRGR